MITGKAKPVEVYRELLRIAESKETPPPELPDGNGNGMRPGNVDLALSGAKGENINLMLAERYWKIRGLRSKAITQELHLSREIAKMDKNELELIAEVPKRIEELPASMLGDCYICGGGGHWSYTCTKRVSR